MTSVRFFTINRIYFWIFSSVLVDLAEHCKVKGFLNAVSAETVSLYCLGSGITQSGLVSKFICSLHSDFEQDLSGLLPKKLTFKFIIGFVAGRRMVLRIKSIKKYQYEFL